MKREITRKRNGRFCTLQITLEQRSDPSNQGEHLRLSICGTSGRIMKRKLAKTEAIRYWESFFEDEPAQRHEMNDRCGRNFRTARSAARFVVASDGDFHGLDVTKEDGNDVYIGESFGQIREDLSKWFPECVPYLPYHLNDMRPGCEHQDALGWGHGKTIALDASSLTEAQRESIERLGDRKVATMRKERFKVRWAELQSSEFTAVQWIKSHNGGVCSVDQKTQLMYQGSGYSVAMSRDLKTFERWLTEDVANEIPVQRFEAEIFKDCIGAPCPVCGYRYGSQWLSRPLPPEVIAWAETFGVPGSAEDV